MELHHGWNRQELRDPVRGVYQSIPEYAHAGRGDRIHFRHRGHATV